MQAITSTRPGGYIGYVGVPHGVSLDGEQLFFSHIHLHGGPAPVRRYLPELIKLVLNGKINPGKVFGYQSSCQHRELVGGAQAPLLRVPLADGTLVATSDVPSEDLIPSLLTLSDVMGTGWFAADAANVKPGSTVVVVGDGAVGLLGVLSAKQMGAKRIIAMSRHASRQKLAREFGATDIVTERGNEGRAAGSNLRNLGASLVPRCRDKKNVYLPMLEVLSKGGGRESRANLSPAQKKRRRGTHF